MFSRTLHPRPRNRRCRPSQAAGRSIGYGRPGAGGITVVATGLAGQQRARRRPVATPSPPHRQWAAESGELLLYEAMVAARRPKAAGT